MKALEEAKGVISEFIVGHSRRIPVIAPNSSVTPCTPSVNQLQEIRALNRHGGF
jgi:hypothetical protein